MKPRIIEIEICINCNTYASSTVEHFCQCKLPDTTKWIKVKVVVLEDIRQMISHEKIEEILIDIVKDMDSGFNPHKGDLTELATGLSDELKQLLEGEG